MPSSFNDIIAWLAARGISEAAAKEYGLVWAGGRLGIPVRRPSGTMFYKWRRDPAQDGQEGGPPKYTADPGGARTLYLGHRLPPDRFTPVVIAEGELDAIRLRVAGLWAVSSTAGASNWDREWDNLFRDRPVVIFYDADAAGQGGALSVAKAVSHAADTVMIVSHDGRWGKDATEVLQRVGDADFLKRLFLRRIAGMDYEQILWSPEPKKPLIQELKEKPPIVAIMEHYGVTFRRSGREMVGRCLIHGDKNPSMSVNPEKGLWCCYGCGAAGDAYSFVMAMEKVDFKGAKEIIERML